MSRHRRLGVLFGLLAFVGLCVAALLSPWSPSSRFSGLPGIEDDITDRVESVLAAQGVTNAEVSVDGQDVSVLIPDAASQNAELLGELIAAEDGVAGVSIAADPTIDAQPAGPDADADAVPTETPAADPTATTEPEPEPTEEPAPEPTATPEPEPEPEPAPDPTATAEPEPAPSAEEIVAGLDVSTVLFEPGTAVLTAADQAVLDGLVPQLQLLDDAAIEVQAHTDALGDPDVNLLLSQDRAEAVANYLIEQGVDAPVLTPRGYGASNPIADNSTEQGRAANQRVALVVEGN